VLGLNKSSSTIEVESTDERGTVFCGKVDGHEQFLIVEIKKGKVRGGHYHNIDTFHFILTGNVTYYEKQLLENGVEKNQEDLIKKVNKGTVINTKAYAAHLIIANEDSFIVESSPENKITTNYQPYRKLVNGKK